MSASDDLGALVEQAARLVGQIGDLAERDRQSYKAGYREAAALHPAVFADGVDVGRAQAERAETARWAPIITAVTSKAGGPSHDDLAARRNTPGGEVYFAAVQRHRGTEYGGMDRARPVAPAAIEATAAWALHRQQQGRAA